MEQKKKEHIKKMAADRRMAQKFFLIQVQNFEIYIYSIFFQAMVTSATAAAGIATVRNRPPKSTNTQC